MSTLTGKTALITGASRGIGEATGRYLAEQGMNVVLAARSAGAIERIAGEIGDHAIAVSGDVANYDDVQRMVTAAIEGFGSLDLLVNNAGLIDPIARIEDSDPEAWGLVVDVNVKGVYHGYRAAIPQMLKQGSGTIVNISSGAATGALEGWSHYCATKAAVLSLTRCGHKELGDKGIRVVGLSPGTVATEMQVQIKASGINPVSQLDPSAHIPAEYVAKAIAWLAEDGADEYLGADFSLKTDEGRAKIGLPLVS